MNRERIGLLLAYVILVGVVAWSSFDTKRTLDRIETETCASAAALLLVSAVYIEDRVESGEVLTADETTAVNVAVRLITEACNIEAPVPLSIPSEE